MTAGADTPSSGAATGTRSHALVRALASLLLILFVANLALLVRAYVLYQRADSTTTTVIGSSNDLLIALLNAETGQRGYLLTSKPVYLQPYDTALSAVPADQRRLASQASAVPDSRHYVAALNSLIAEKMKELAETISLGHAGDHAAARRKVDTGEGKQVMDKVRRVTADLQRAATAAGASRRSGLHIQLRIFIVLAAVLAVADVYAGLVLRRRLRAKGERVPSTNELAAYYRINPATAAKGINLLADDGLLEKRRGIGMFVAAGARQRLLAQRRERFVERYVRPLLTEATRLGIDSGELIAAIKECGHEWLSDSRGGVAV